MDRGWIFVNCMVLGPLLGDVSAAVREFGQRHISMKIGTYPCIEPKKNHIFSSSKTFFQKRVGNFWSEKVKNHENDPFRDWSTSSIEESRQHFFAWKSLRKLSRLLEAREVNYTTKSFTNEIRI